MTTFLAVALLVVGSASTLAAFGGETCEKGDKPLFERITPRGWISLFCLLLAFALGTIKEMHTAQKESEKQRIADQKQSEADHQHQLEKEASDEEVAAAKAREELANERLVSLQKIDQVTQDRLIETKSTLNDVRMNLETTRNDLSQQSAASLVTALANVDRHISDIAFFLPLTAEGNRTKSIRQALLPSFHDDACSDLTGIGFTIAITRDHREIIIYNPTDNSSSHDYFADIIQKQDSVASPEEFKQVRAGNTVKSTVNLINQTSLNGYLYSAYFHATSPPIPAAEFYALMMQPGSEMIAIATSWPAPFSSAQQYAEAIEKYPSILDREVSMFGSDSKGRPKRLAKIPYPIACLNRVHQYFESAFQKALLLVSLDGPGNETLFFHLRARPPRLIDQMWEVSFAVDSPPTVVALGDRTLGTLHDWPSRTNSVKPK